MCWLAVNQRKEHLRCDILDVAAVAEVVEEADCVGGEAADGRVPQTARSATEPQKQHERDVTWLTVCVTRAVKTRCRVKPGCD